MSLPYIILDVARVAPLALDDFLASLGEAVEPDDDYSNLAFDGADVRASGGSPADGNPLLSISGRADVEDLLASWDRRGLDVVARLETEGEDEQEGSLAYYCPELPNPLAAVPCTRGGAPVVDPVVLRAAADGQPQSREHLRSAILLDHVEAYEAALRIR